MQTFIIHRQATDKRILLKCLYWLVISLNLAQKWLILSTGEPQSSFAFRRPNSGQTSLLLASSSHQDELIVLPDEHFQVNSSQDLASVNLIDRKRYVEAVSSRCFASTVLENVAELEPDFVVISPSGEVRLKTSASLEQIEASGFRWPLHTTILVHGFTQSYPDTPWLRHARALFEENLLVARHNLIIMDWGKASHGSYSQVAASVSAMGSFLANFIAKLVELGADRTAIEIVGHSLGAHVAGFAGKRLRPRIGRITALDAAGPCFGKVYSNGPKDRLAADDALEVSVYHYDDDFLGLPGQTGQLDVLVNGGSSQPGCKDNLNSMLQALLTVVFRRNRVLSESHTRSTEVATQRLSRTQCQQVAYECRDWAAFLSGECAKCDPQNQQCHLMGFFFQYAGARPAPIRTSFPGKRFYIVTGDTEPFCLQHQQLLARFEPAPELGQLIKRNKWRLHVEFISDTGERINATIFNQMAPYVMSHLLLMPDVGRPARLVAGRLQARSADGSPVVLGPLSGGQRAPAPRLLVLEANFMSAWDYQRRRALSSRLCPTTTKPANEQENSITDSTDDSAWLYLELC